MGPGVYLLLAAMVMLEGPAATLLGAAAAAAGLLHPLAVFLAAGTGNLCGDVVWYSLGALGKASWIADKAPWLGVTRERTALMERRMRSSAPSIIFIAKLTLFFSVPALVAAGIARARFRRWFPADVLAEAIWTGTLTMFGYFAALYAAQTRPVVKILVLTGGPALFLTGIMLLRCAGSRWGAEREDTAPQA